MEAVRRFIVMPQRIRKRRSMMDKKWKQMTDFLVNLGVEQVAHTHKSYLAHLIAVYRLMEKHGCTEEVCRAGMFHSIYGTELFQGFKLPVDRRSEIRDLIGDRAERLAYLNCAMDRASFDRALECGQARYQIVDRLTGEEVHLNQADFDDLCRVHLYDFLEQVARAQRWDYRRSAYRRMAERLGADATGAYDMVFKRQSEQ
jgi:Domain of unknown function (DUF6817)